MTRRAWGFVIAVTLAGGELLWLLESSWAVPSGQWQLFLVLTALATIAQTVSTEEADHQSYHPTLVFVFAAALLLPPVCVLLLLITSHSVEWGKERWVGSGRLRAWYIQPFNIVVHFVSAMSAHWLFVTFNPASGRLTSTGSVLATVAAATSYVVLNHYLVGQIVVLARGISWRESGVLDLANVVTDLIMLFLGSVVAVLWTVNSLLLLPALTPLVLMHRALMIPALMKSAHTDEKTGLWNARHWASLFEAEFERAKRFNRPLAIIMADLDLLRNINNTYGHLAGDVVLEGIGEIIRDSMRDYDIAGRFGGEEFAIALPETELVEATTVAERLRNRVEVHGFEVDTNPTPIQATLSLGVACFPTDARGPQELIHEADIAVYQAKLRGRNQVVVAADIPHFVKLEGADLAERLDESYAAAFVPRPHIGKQDSSCEPQSSEDSTGRDSATVSEDVAHEHLRESDGNAKSGESASRWLRPFVSGVIAAGILVTIWGLANTDNSLAGAASILLLVLLATGAEIFQVTVYDEGTMSVSLSMNFAAAILGGIPGVAVVSAAAALAHRVLRRPALHQTAFNWAIHLLAGSVVALAFRYVDTSIDGISLPTLVLPAAIAAAAYFTIETVLVATAQGLTTGQSIRRTWRDQYRWLAGHYAVLCLMGLLMALAFYTYGTAGVLMFALPLLLLRYAQKQYVDRTSASVRELQRMNYELASANRQVIQASKAIRELNDELFLTLAKIIDARDPYVHSHAAQVAEYATRIAVDLGMPSERVEQIRQAAFLHDIGKIVLSERILHKPAKLTTTEYDYVKAHVTLGAELLETSHGLRHLAPFARHHHERWDGDGYPDGLAGEAIPLEARILAVCDAVEAMASDRPYHPALTLEEIMAELKTCAGSQFDPDVVAAFMRVVARDGRQLVVNTAREVTLRYESGDEDALARFRQALVPIL